MNIFNPQALLDAWYVVAIAYFIWCWGLPMIGMTTNPYVKEHNCYWKGVRYVSAMFHVATIAAFTLMYFLEPYMFPGA